jgi:hypothetical protein
MLIARGILRFEGMQLDSRRLGAHSGNGEQLNLSLAESAVAAFKRAYDTQEIGYDTCYAGWLAKDNDRCGSIGDFLLYFPNTGGPHRRP